MKKIIVVLFAMLSAPFVLAATSANPQWPAQIMYVGYQCDNQLNVDHSQWTFMTISKQDPNPGPYAIFHGNTDTRVVVDGDTVYIRVQPTRGDWPARTIPIGQISSPDGTCARDDDDNGSVGYVSKEMSVRLNDGISVNLTPTGNSCAPGVRDAYIKNSLIVSVAGVGTYTIQPADCY